MKKEVRSKREVPSETDEKTANDQHDTVPETSSDQARRPKTARTSLIRQHPVRTAAICGLSLIALIAAIPQTRYPILGAFIDQKVRLQVIDSKTGKPVSAAEVTAASGSAAATDEEGVVFLELPVGKTSLAVKKANYADSTVSLFVGLRRTVAEPFPLVATGRQVAVSVSNRISGQPLEKATLKAGEIEAVTNDAGKATLVVPADSEAFKLTLSAAGYNTTETELTVTDSTEPDKDNQFRITPAGKVYFLSKRSGKIDVVKSDLDGKNRKVVLKGTGKESDSDTVLLASRDWKYLALKSKRDGGKYPKLFLIDTSNDSLVLIDQGDARFDPIGWSGQYFLYHVSRESGLRNPGAQRLKSYNAPTRAITVLASSDGEGTASHHSYQEFSSATILDNSLLFVSDWYATSYSRYEGKKAEVTLIQPNGEGKKTLLSHSSRPTSINIAPYELNGVYITTNNYLTDKTVYYEYESGDSLPAVVKISSEEFYKNYPTFLVSPSGKRIFWAESRDGKNTLLVGDVSSQKGVVTASDKDFKPYGWFTDEYVLISKDSSELYIQSPEKGAKPLKVTDYHKPDTEFEGYGYGYGGL